MNSISVSVNVSIDFSESTKAFIQGLFSSNALAAKPVVEAPKAPAAKPVVEAPKVPAAKPVVEAPKAPAAKPVAEAPKAKQISIDEIRSLLKDKVNAHRGEIKDKLNEFGAPSVTKLDADKYQEMFDFLNSLD